VLMGARLRAQGEKDAALAMFLSRSWHGLARADCIRACGGAAARPIPASPFCRGDPQRADPAPQRIGNWPLEPLVPGELTWVRGSTGTLWAGGKGDRTSGGAGRERGHPGAGQPGERHACRWVYGAPPTPGRRASPPCWPALGPVTVEQGGPARAGPAQQSRGEKPMAGGHPCD